MSGIHGYKVFNSDWTCTPASALGVCKQYTCPGVFEENVELNICDSGMHFCKKAVDCFNYYVFDPSYKVAEVIAHGDVVEKGDKCCTNKLEIVREVSWSEVLEIVNMGNGCTGLKNSGNCNSGNYNSGYRNSGCWNIGDLNSGSYNSGNYNSGSFNSGDLNSGSYNSGNLNSGSFNSGNYNSGYRNSGDWNLCNYSSGCFNTVEQTIYLFNKPSNWTYEDWRYSKAMRVLSTMPLDDTMFIPYNNMDEKEIEQHPDSKTTGGYLKHEHYTDRDRQNWWEDLPKTDKKEVLAIPNFDAEIFYEITGINVNQ